MSRSLSCAAAVALVMLAALPARAEDDDEILVAPSVAMPFDWSGIYVGAHAGYGFGETESNLKRQLGFSSPLGSLDVDGFVGGVHAGITYQMTGFVVGLEADFGGSTVGGSGVDTNPLFVGPVHGTWDLEWQGSVRARLGYAVDRLLVYGTGGFAYGNAAIKASVTSAGGGGPATAAAAAATTTSASEDKFLTGWTLGAGLEYAFTDNLMARVEYRYTDLGEATYSATTALGAGSASFGVTDSQVLAGISYRF